MPDTQPPDVPDVVGLEPMTHGLRVHTIRVSRRPADGGYFGGYRPEPHTELVHRPYDPERPEDIDGFYLIEQRPADEVALLLPRIPAQYLGENEYCGETVTQLVHLEFAAAHDQLGRALWPHPGLGPCVIEVWVTEADQCRVALINSMKEPLPLGADVAAHGAVRQPGSGFDHHVVFDVWPIQVSMFRTENGRRTRFLGVARYPDKTTEPWVWLLTGTPPLFEVTRTSEAPPAPSPMT